MCYNQYRVEGDPMYDINILTSNGIDVNSSLELFGTIDTYNDTVGEFLLSAKEKIVLLKQRRRNIWISWK